MTALAVPPIVELCALDSKLDRSLSGSDPIIVHANPTASETTIKTPIVWPDVSNFHHSAGGDRQENPIGSAHAVHPRPRTFRP
jgi:hypothetical protein